MFILTLISFPSRKAKEQQKHQMLREKKRTLPHTVMYNICSQSYTQSPLGLASQMRTRWAAGEGVPAKEPFVTKQQHHLYSSQPKQNSPVFKKRNKTNTKWFL